MAGTGDVVAARMGVLVVAPFLQKYLQSVAVATGYPNMGGAMPYSFGMGLFSIYGLSRGISCHIYNIQYFHFADPFCPCRDSEKCFYATLPFRWDFVV